MSDATILQTYGADVAGPLARAGYSGAAAVFEAGPAVDLSLYKDARVSVQGCGGDGGLTLETSTSLTLTAVRSGDTVTVSFSLSTTLDVALPLAGGGVNAFSAGLAITGDFSFRFQPASYCEDIRTYCGEVVRTCGGAGGGQIAVAKAGFALNASTALWFGDAGETGQGALMMSGGKVDLFSGGAAGDGDSLQAASGTALGALALSLALGGERAGGDPLRGVSVEDAALLKAIGLGAAAMSADESEAQALRTTLGLTYAGVGLVADYAGKAMAMAAVAPTDLALAARSDSGVKGDGLTNVRQVQVDGQAGAYANVKLYDGERLVAQGQADRSGAFHLTTGSLSDGAHSLTAVATDAGGVAVRSDPLSLTIDTRGPAAPVVDHLSLAGIGGAAEAGGKVTVYDGFRVAGVAEVGADGRWNLAYAVTDTSVHTFTAVAQDAAGNATTAAGSALITRAAAGRLSGGAGDDLLVAGPDDVLVGGMGRDLFVYGEAGGRATVADFRGGVDQVRLEDGVFRDFADLKAHAVQRGADVVITADADHVLTLKSVGLASLSAGDFLFG